MSDKKTDETPPQVAQSSAAFKAAAEHDMEHDSGDVTDDDVMDGDVMDDVMDKGAVSLRFDFICLHPALSLSRP
jgi:hypothetical protein